MVRPVGMPALGRSLVKAGLDALQEEIPLEFHYRIDNMHGEFARRAYEIDTAKHQAVNPDIDRTHEGLPSLRRHPWYCARDGRVRRRPGHCRDQAVDEPPVLQSVADGGASRDYLGDEASKPKPKRPKTYKKRIPN